MRYKLAIVAFLLAIVPASCCGPSAAETIEATQDGLLVMRAAHLNQSAILERLTDAAAERGAPAESVTIWRDASARNKDAFERAFVATMLLLAEQGSLTIEDVATLATMTSEQILKWRQQR